MLVPLLRTRPFPVSAFPIAVLLPGSQAAADFQLHGWFLLINSTKQALARVANAIYFPSVGGHFPSSFVLNASVELLVNDQPQHPVDMHPEVPPVNRGG
ncbi:hypothetical protein CB1_000478001 [Camelus ferus]|nr:hypothetical protein CB1_000478001 [Camelus ferus]